MNIDKRFITQKKAHKYQKKSQSLELEVSVFSFHIKELRKDNKKLRKQIYKLKHTRFIRFKNYIKRKFGCGYQSI